MGLILDGSVFIADEREAFNLSAWLRARPPEPVAVRAITSSEFWFGIEAEEDAPQARRRRRWAVATFDAREFRNIRFPEVVVP